MKTFVYSLAAGLTAAMLMTGPVSAATTTVTETTTTKAVHRHMALDQYGCRTTRMGDYRCYRGAMAGERYRSQAAMLEANTDSGTRMMRVQTTMRPGERLVPVYVDDDGAPRPLPPQTSRGRETPPIDSDMAEITIW